VFGNRQGDALRESTLLTNVLQPAAQSEGLGRMTWHQCRHIHSSLLNDLKVPLKIAQERLSRGGRASPICRPPAGRRDDDGAERPIRHLTKTGYKIFDRYKDYGVHGLTDRSRRPYRHANRSRWCSTRRSSD
jgi:hypothetical protein